MPTNVKNTRKMMSQIMSDEPDDENKSNSPKEKIVTKTYIALNVKKDNRNLNAKFV